MFIYGNKLILCNFLNDKAMNQTLPVQKKNKQNKRNFNFYAGFEPKTKIVLIV